jgi:transglutaminase-like putative cysteine protease
MGFSSFKLTIPAVLFAACSLLSAGATTVVDAKPFSVRPPQSWVKVNSADLKPNNEAGRTTGSSTGSSSMLLDDYQIRVSDKGTERYYHYAERIETTSGLDDLSQLKFDFEPSYQQLTIHFIRVYRNGNVIDALKPSEIKIIQKEDELDQQLYNGTLAALIFMNDLRVGDVVDYAYTVTGENPVLGGRFADRIYLADSKAVQRLIVRLVWPAHRTLEIRKHDTNLEPAVQTSANESEYVWDRLDAPAVEVEDLTPGWVEKVPAVDLTEFKTWADVVQWALPLFKVSGTSPAQLEAKVQGWKSQLPTPELRLIAALRFVQDEVRYLGIELGRYSHQPSQPATVFSRRFGDCKDKSFLLSIILNSLGIDAAPALVNAKKGKSLDNWQPSPFAFNHVIVQAKLDGRVYWLDPTISSQRGGLGSYYDPPYARALVLREGVAALENIPRPSSSSGSTAVNDVYTLHDNSPVTYQVTTTYRGSDADDMRSDLADQSLDELSKGALNYYASDIPSIRAEGLPQVHDDQNANTITITERYIIDDFWKEQKHLFIADRIYNQLGKPGISRRSLPLAVTYPMAITQTTEIELSAAESVPLYSGNISDAALSFDYAQSRSGNRIKLEYSLKALDDHVPVALVAKHMEALEEMRGAVGFRLPVAAISVSGSQGGSSGAIIVFLTALALLGLGAVFLIRHRLRMPASERRKTVPASAGSTPETAISVKTSEEILTFLSGFKCRCGKRPYQTESPPSRERFTYDERLLTGVRMKCTDCGQSVDLYFSPQIQEVTVT